MFLLAFSFNLISFSCCVATPHVLVFALVHDTTGFFYGSLVRWPMQKGLTLTAVHC